MLTQQQIREALIIEYGQPILRDVNEYGCSGVGFCQEKFVIKHRLGIEEPTNFKMLQGKLFHRTLPDIIKNTPYGLAHGETPKKRWQHRKQAPAYERAIRYDTELGFHIVGHVDCDLPACNRIIELKTTGSPKAWFTGDFLTDTYIMQANAYAVMAEREFFEIWVVWLGFDNLAEDPLVSVIEQPASDATFIEFINRLDFINKACNRDIDLVGPEKDWECPNCGLILQCPYWKNCLERVIACFPMKKPEEGSDPELEKGFKMCADRSWIHFDRSQKVYFFDGRTITEQEQTKNDRRTAEENHQTE